MQKSALNGSNLVTLKYMIPTPSSFSTTISLRKLDGLHATVGWSEPPYPTPVYTAAWMWTRPQTLREHKLRDGLLISGLCAFAKPNRLVVAGFERAGQPLQIAEYSLDAQPFSLSGPPISFGDQFSTAPIICELNSGGLIIFVYQRGTPLRLKAAYRRPAGDWWFGEFEFFVPNQEIGSMQYTVAQQSDGRVWLFASLDGSGRFGLAQFEEVDGEIRVAANYIHDYLSDEINNGIYRDGDMVPGDELPCLAATPDPANGRILLLYPKNQAIWPDGAYGLGYENAVIVACYPDLRRELIAKLPHLMDSHSGYPGMVWPLSNKINYMVPSWNQDTRLTKWQTGSIDSAGQISPNRISNIAVGSIAFGPDGSIAFGLNGGFVVTGAQALSKSDKVK
jgi:hypothetical protein